MIKRALAFLALLFLYGAVWTIALMGRCLSGGPRRRASGQARPLNGRERILVTGTFHNPNWYLSHIRPLAQCGVGRVIVVTDQPQREVPGVQFCCPPPWLARWAGRAAAKFVWSMAAGVRHRPDLYIGYSFFPGGCSALLAGSLLGRPACYQCTSGPVDIAGGGHGKDGPLTSRLGAPRPLLERLCMAVLRQFELVVVRGQGARRFFRERGLKRTVRIITGSISPAPRQRSEAADRDIDLIYVGRLEAVKQPRQFVEVVAAARAAMPAVRAAMVGDGELMQDVRRRADELGLNGQLQFTGKRADVEAMIARAKVFVLPSRSEGLSIALAEAMAAGAVPVVADVGDLRDLVDDGRTGYTVTPGHIEQYVERAVALLRDEALRRRMSASAAEAAVGLCSLDRVTGRWREAIGSAMNHHT